MDYYQYDNNQNGPDNNNGPINSGNNSYNNTQPPVVKNTFGTASLVFALLAIPGTMTVWFGIIFGIAAIALAILSRGRMGRFEGLAIPGLIMGIIFIVISLLLFVIILQMLNSPEMVNTLNQYMQNMYGDTL